MKNDQRTYSTLRNLSALALAVVLALPQVSQAASITLATSPLATSTTSTVLPNVMFLLDNSGSMDWDHMPDDNSDGGSAVSFDYGYYGIRSSQCNQVYYQPNTTYLPPVGATGAAYADASFTSACTNGFSGTCSVNLNTGYKANQAAVGGNAGGTDSSGGPAYYYQYSGSQTTDLQRNYNSTSNTFYNECHSAQDVSPGKDVFTRISLSDSAAATTATIVVGGSGSTTVSSIKVNGTQEIMSGTTVGSTTTSTVASQIAAQINLCTIAQVGNCTSAGGHGYTAATSGTSKVTITGLPATANSLIVTQSGTMTLTRTIFPVANAANLTNFANWYSFYRTRLMMMKTAAGRAFKTLDNHYRVGFTKLDSSDTPTEYLDTFAGTQRTNWYSSLYGTVANGSTPLRQALSDSGRYYAGKESGADPIQYSCQQNFTIMSTDGFWNGSAGYKLNGSTAVGNQDGGADRPMYDGSNQTKTSTQISQSQTQCSQQTSSLIGTISKVLMRCNNTAAVCGAAPATGVADANWSVVTSGSCTVASNTQCSAVNVVPSGTSAVATNCNTGATIITGTTGGTATITITNVCTASNCNGGNGASLNSVIVGGVQILAGQTNDNTSQNTVASRVASGINACTSSKWKTNCDVTGNSATVNNNVVTITGPDVTGSPTVNVSKGTATVTVSYTAGGSTYTLNNADSNGDIYSSCAYTGWSAAALAASCSTVNQANNPNKTSITTASQYTTNTKQTNTLVASCTAGNSGAPDYIETTCTPSTTTANNVTSCTPQSASSSNNYTSITCTGGTTGGTSDTLADVAMYYYQTDLRTSTLGNCTGAMGTGVDVCPNNVFRTDTDSNTQQHMVTFTLGMGASGRMHYSSSYLTDTDTSGDYFSVWKGVTARPNAAAMLISITGTAATSVSSIKVGGTELMSGATTGETDPITLAGKIAAKITQNGYTATASGSTVTITPTPTSTPVISKAGDMIFTVGPVCSWGTDGNPCNWPIPGMDSNGNGYISNIDDLWHAAVNGHGQYFSATSPTSLSSGLSSALATIASRKGSSAAAATSTLNPVPGNNYAYVASYTTVKWQGNLEARTIDVNTAVISDSASWCVESIVAGICPAPATIVVDTSGSSAAYNCVTTGSTAATCASPGVFDPSTNNCNVPMATSCTGTMPGKIGANSDTRTIYTANSTGTALVSFDATYATSNPTNFSAAHINTLSQWSSLTATQQAAASGTNLINFLRGQTGYEDRTSNLVGSVDNRLYRYRESTLGDALESQPIFIAKPVFNYADPGYSAFVTAQANRPGTVYMGTNDGMLHAFSALDEGTSPVVKGGTERWAYVPSVVIPNMWKLADKNYSTQHTNFVNGSPIISDVCTANCTDSTTAVWRTILVGGLNAGGQGYFALDITDPTAPTLLWEFTTANDSDLGNSYGNPVITAKADGTWVVLLTSGYNNNVVTGSTGKGFLYVLNAGTGAIISKIGTGVGSTGTPSGLAKISAWSDASASNRATYVYGGDLLGNVWRFNINGSTAAAIGTGDVEQFAILRDPSGATQPITTAPVLGQILSQRVIFVGTGKYLENADLTNTQVQSEYALKDDGSTYTNPAGSPRNSTTLVQQTLTTANGTRTASNNPVDFSTGHGWYVDFPDSGERSDIESRLVQGTLLVATIVPSNTVCSPGGYGWLNFFDYKTGSSIDASGVVSVSYDNSIVGINVLYINGAPVVEAVTSNNPTPTVNKDVLIKPPASGFTGVRLLWRELNP